MNGRMKQGELGCDKSGKKKLQVGKHHKRRRMRDRGNMEKKRKNQWRKEEERQMDGRRWKKEGGK